MNKIYLYVIALLLVVSSCGDFLEEASQNLTYVESTQDFDELLILAKTENRRSISFCLVRRDG